MNPITESEKIFYLEAWAFSAAIVASIACIASSTPAIHFTGVILGIASIILLVIYLMILAVSARIKRFLKSLD